MLFIQIRSYLYLVMYSCKTQQCKSEIKPSEMVGEFRLRRRASDEIVNCPTFKLPFYFRHWNKNRESGLLRSTYIWKTSRSCSQKIHAWSSHISGVTKHNHHTNVTRRALLWPEASSANKADITLQTPLLHFISNCVWFDVHCCHFFVVRDIYYI